MKPDTQDVSGLQSAICDAISTHLDGLEGEKDKRNGSLPAKVQQLLKDADGDFLKLCSTLVDMQLLSMDNLDGVVRLCKVIEKVLPQEEKKRAKFHDPMDNVKAWPTQVKRDSLAGSRTAFLKGVGHLTSINQLQALVWGGPLEHIFLPESGKDFAMVKFLKAADCKRYFDATENGIQLPDKTKKLVFVDQRGPNSTNDVSKET
jgi:protein-S-isoprenylcysteine O-methyltransferase